MASYGYRDPWLNHTTPPSAFSMASCLLDIVLPAKPLPAPTSKGWSIAALSSQGFVTVGEPHHTHRHVVFPFVYQPRALLLQHIVQRGIVGAAIKARSIESDLIRCFELGPIKVRVYNLDKPFPYSSIPESLARQCPFFRLEGLVTGPSSFTLRRYYL